LAEEQYCRLAETLGRILIPHLHLFINSGPDHRSLCGVVFQTSWKDLGQRGLDSCNDPGRFEDDNTDRKRL